MSGRVAVVLVGTEGATLVVYALTAAGRLRAHARRAVALADTRWPALRASLAPLAALARARGAAQVVVALRASLNSGRWIRRAREDAHHMRCDLLPMTTGDELRWIFLGGVRAVSAPDGVVAELEPTGTSLARFRGRVLANAARIGPRENPAASGLALGSRGGALVVSGALVQKGTADQVVKRLMKWTGSDEVVMVSDALSAGLAAALLRAPVPDVFRPTRS
jgi:hypothetical protein